MMKRIAILALLACTPLFGQTEIPEAVELDREPLTDGSQECDPTEDSLRLSKGTMAKIYFCDCDYGVSCSFTSGCCWNQQQGTAGTGIGGDDTEILFNNAGSADGAAPTFDSVSGRLKFELFPFADPTHPTYGADPTGTADSSTAIADAITAAVAAGVAVHIPAGTYRLDSCLTIPADAHIYGAGVEGTTIDLVGSTTCAFTIGADDTSDVTIRDLSIVSSTTAKTAHAFDLSGMWTGTDRWKLRNIRMEGVEACILGTAVDGKGGVDFEIMNLSCSASNTGFDFRSEDWQFQLYSSSATAIDAYSLRIGATNFSVYGGEYSSLGQESIRLEGASNGNFGAVKATSGTSSAKPAVRLINDGTNAVESIRFDGGTLSAACEHDHVVVLDASAGEPGLDLVFSGVTFSSPLVSAFENDGRPTESVGTLINIDTTSTCNVATPTNPNTAPSLPASCTGREFFVDPGDVGCDDEANTGLSQGDPFCTLPGTFADDDSAEISDNWGGLPGSGKIGSGDCVWIKGGSLFEDQVPRVTTTYYQNGTSIAPVQIRVHPTWGTGGAIFDGTGVTTAGGFSAGLFNLRDLSHVVLAGRDSTDRLAIIDADSAEFSYGLIVDGGSAGDGIFFYYGELSGSQYGGAFAETQDSWVYDLWAHDNAGSSGEGVGFVCSIFDDTQASTNLSVYNSLFESNGGVTPDGGQNQHGMTSLGCQGLVIYGSTFRDNTRDGFDSGTSSNAANSSVRVDSCIAHDNGEDGIAGNGGTGINAINVWNSVAFGNGESGFKAYDGIEVQWINNLAHHNGQGGSTQFGGNFMPYGENGNDLTLLMLNNIGVAPDGYVNVYNFSQTGAGSDPGCPGAGLCCDGFGDPDCCNGNGATPNDALTTITSDYNIFVPRSLDSEFGFEVNEFQGNGCQQYTYSSPPSWIGTNDCVGIACLPTFSAALSTVDYESNDYVPAVGDTQAKDQGTTSNLFSIDLRGVARPNGSAWDIGPYEYAPATGTATDADLFEVGQDAGFLVADSHRYNRLNVTEYMKVENGSVQIDVDAGDPTLDFSKDDTPVGKIRVTDTQIILGDAGGATRATVDISGGTAGQVNSTAKVVAGTGVNVTTGDINIESGTLHTYSVGDPMSCYYETGTGNGLHGCVKYVDQGEVLWTDHNEQLLMRNDLGFLYIPSGAIFLGAEDRQATIISEDGAGNPVAGWTYSRAPGDDCWFNDADLNGFLDNGEVCGDGGSNLAPAGDPGQVQINEDGTVLGAINIWEDAGGDIGFGDFSAEDPQCTYHIRTEDQNISFIPPSSDDLCVESTSAGITMITDNANPSRIDMRTETGHGLLRMTSILTPIAAPSQQLDIAIGNPETWSSSPTTANITVLRSNIFTDGNGTLDEGQTIRIGSSSLDTVTVMGDLSVSGTCTGCGGGSTSATTQSMGVTFVDDIDSPTVSVRPFEIDVTFEDDAEATAAFQVNDGTDTGLAETAMLLNGRNSAGYQPNTEIIDYLFLSPTPGSFNFLLDADTQGSTILRQFDTGGISRNLMAFSGAEPETRLLDQLDVNNHVVEGLAAPTADDHAVNKAYVDDGFVAKYVQASEPATSTCNDDTDLGDEWHKPHGSGRGSVMHKCFADKDGSYAWFALFEGRR